MVQQGIIFKAPSSTYYHKAITFIFSVDAILKSIYDLLLGSVYVSPFFEQLENVNCPFFVQLK